MKLSHRAPSAKSPKTAFLIVLAPEGQKPSLPEGVQVPAAALDDFKGERRKTRLTDASAGAARRVLFVGLGPAKEVDAEGLRRAAAIGV